MPRRARITVPGIPWHIIQRGNNRSACFYTESDYQYYLCTLGEQAEKYGCAIFSKKLKKCSGEGLRPVKVVDLQNAGRGKPWSVPC